MTFREWWATVMANPQLNIDKWCIEYSAHVGFTAGFGAGYPAAEIAALRAEVERLKAENDGMRNALAGVPDPAKLIEAVDNVLKMSKGQALPHHVWAVIDALRAARGPKGVGK